MTETDPLHAYYELGEEEARLAEPFGQVEYLRTLDVLDEHLPPAPAVVADIGDARPLDLAEARRVGRPGAVVLAAAISRWAPRLHGVLVARLDLQVPQLLPMLEDVVEVDGRLPPLFPGSFNGHTHRPDELRAEASDAGLVVEDLSGLESMSFALPDLEERMADPAARAVVLGSARAVQRVPELLGLSPHLLVVARVP